MPTVTDSELRRTAAHAVEAFESALASGRPARPDDFAPPPGDPARGVALVELIRVDLEYHWRAGRPVRLDDYRRQFPEAFTGPAVQGLAFEEYRLRRDAGHDVRPAEYARAYGVDTRGWQLFPPGSLAVLFRDRTPPPGAATAVICRPAAADSLPFADPLDELPEGVRESVRRASARHPQVAAQVARVQRLFPKAGTEFLGFRLVEELGRGAFGRVYLARQSDLSGRPVALKVAADVGAESRSLAQLQHTNIVPVYSYHRADALQAVCMPYFGRVTLADLLRSIKMTHTVPRTGRELRSIVAQPSWASDAAAPMPAPTGPAVDSEWAKLEGWDYVRAVVWFGSQLAEGLAHAHARGIIHRDLKPANVLLTDDGRPMLLDFNLAEDVKARGTAEAMIGGTLPYMPPEQLRAFAGDPLVLDHRVDLYALGVILFELLTGRSPYSSVGEMDDEALRAMATEREAPPPSVRAASPVVSWAVDAIVRMCLAPNPDDRYRSALDLRDDLTRELADRPLAFARNPSAREGVRKWVKRHPRLTSSGTVAAVAAAVLAVAVGGWWAGFEHTRSLEAREQFAAHTSAFRDAQAFADDRNNTLAKADEGADRLRAVLDRYAVTDATEPAAVFARADVARLTAADRDRLRDDIGEACYLLANLNLERALVPDAADRGERLDDAEKWNRTAGRFGDRIPRAVDRQRATLDQLLGRPPAEPAADTRPPDSARDHYLSAYGLYRAGRYADALPGLRAATQIDPENFSAWFVRGQVHLELEQPELAALCFGSCTALRKEFAPAWLNRGLAYAKLRFYDQARDDYDRAISLRADWAEAYLQRATVAGLLGDFTSAAADLTAALSCGDATPRLFFLRASVRDALGDGVAATADRAEGLARTPADELSWVSRAEVRMAADPTAALADVEQALRLNPLSAPGLQLKAHLLSERLNRADDAERVLDQVVTAYPDSATFRAGRGVLLARRGKWPAARQDARDALLRDGKPPTLYQVGCILALTSPDRREDRAEAVRLVWQALKAGYGLEYVDTDTDLTPLRGDAEFERVVKAAKALHGAPTADR